MITHDSGRGSDDRSSYCEPWGKGDRLPSRLYRILNDEMIDRDDWDIFSLCLGNQNFVKGISIVIWQAVYLKNMEKIDR